LCRSGNPVRIAVYHNLPSGGAKRTLYESVQRLSARHSFDVYTLSTANHEFGDIRPYVNSHRVYEFQPGKLYNSPFGRLNMLVRRSDLGHIQQVCQKIAEDLKSQSYDVIFVNPCQFETAPSILKEEISTPKIYYCQEPPRVIYESMPDAHTNKNRPGGNR
jgi:hypothetical protein